MPPKATTLTFEQRLMLLNLIISKKYLFFGLLNMGEINISSQGEILIQPIGGEPGALPVNIANIATFVPNGENTLKKSLDGHIRFAEIVNANGEAENVPIEPNQQGKIASGFLEKSNVNAIEEMVNTIDQMRKFEMHVKLIQMTEELDTAGTSLMRLPGM